MLKKNKIAKILLGLIVLVHPLITTAQPVLANAEAEIIEMVEEVEKEELEIFEEELEIVEAIEANEDVEAIEEVEVIEEEVNEDVEINEGVEAPELEEDNEVIEEVENDYFEDDFANENVVEIPESDEASYEPVEIPEPDDTTVEAEESEIQEDDSDEETPFEFSASSRSDWSLPQSNITLPNRLLTPIERADWIAEYFAMGGVFEFELEVIRLINELRAERNLVLVELDIPLSMAARFHVQSKITFNTGTVHCHEDLPYECSGRAAKFFTGSYGFFGNGAAARTPEGVVQMWIGSPGHFENMINPDIRFMGIGSHVESVWGAYNYMMARSSVSPPRHYVNVENGTGSGFFKGTVYLGTAYQGNGVWYTNHYTTPDTVAPRAVVPEGHRFTHWTSSIESVEFSDPYNPNTTFTMINEPVTVTAHFEPIPTNVVTVVGGTGGGDFGEGVTVTINATVPTGHRFVRWESDPAVNLANAASATTTFVMPANDVTVTALFESIPAYTVTVLGGTGGGNFEVGEVISITATVPPGFRFVRWESGPAVNLANATSATTTFVMPANDVTVTATFEPIPAYTVTVVGGMGGGDFAEGETVSFTAIVPPGYVFVRWEADPAVNLANATSANTSFVMPANNVTVTAILEPITEATEPTTETTEPTTEATEPTTEATEPTESSTGTTDSSTGTTDSSTGTMDSSTGTIDLSTGTSDSSRGSTGTTDSSTATTVLPSQLSLPQTGAVVGLSALGGVALLGSGFAIAKKKRSKKG